MPYQNTIAHPVETEGVGLHTAVRGHLRLVPAPADTGIVFRRTDLDNFEIEADGRWLARVSYATSLMKKGVLLSTVEHVLAARYRPQRAVRAGVVARERLADAGGRAGDDRAHSRRLSPCRPCPCARRRSGSR